MSERMRSVVSSSSDRVQRSRDERVVGGDRGRVSGTNGARGVTDGAGLRDLNVGWAIVVIVAVGFAAVNALTILSDWPSVAAWEPWLWEGSSAVAIALLAWIPWLAGTVAPIRWVNDGWIGRFRLLSAHLGAACVYSVLHVALMVAMRHGVYSLLDQSYDYGAPVARFVYELRKDLLSYTVFLAVFWFVRSLREAKNTPLRPVSFDIRDGARLIRIAVSEILAVTAAGNYVEFVLADGRRPLMRATLAAVEAELQSYGFARVHRSWLINAARVTGLRREGSGDWTVELGDVETPASRRYANAVNRLRDVHSTSLR